MFKKNIAVIMLIALSMNAFAQQFVDKATVEYEVRTNVLKTLGSGMWADAMRDKIPKFKTGYFNYTFADNKSVYKFDHWLASDKMPDYMRKSEEEQVWYTDFDNENISMQKNVFGTVFNIKDSLKKINWHLSDEQRIIAGYKCRKAVGIIMDSVYVFAFYTDEIMISGGPVTIHGLPGLVLGLTIPRMYASWIATKVTVDKADPKDIKPVSSKKYYTRAEASKIIKERTSDWSDGEDEDENTDGSFADRLVWGVLL